MARRAFRDEGEGLQVVAHSKCAPRTANSVCFIRRSGAEGRSTHARIRVNRRFDRRQRIENGINFAARSVAANVEGEDVGGRRRERVNARVVVHNQRTPLRVQIFES